MKTFKTLTTAAALLTLAGAAWAVDCTHFEDHKPGYCGVTSNDVKCNDAANRVPGKCGIAANAVDKGFTLSLPAGSGGTPGKIPPILMGQADVSKLPAKMVNGQKMVSLNNKWYSLVASGGGNYNLVASGGGN